jgi:hypothetical protein
MLSAFLAWSRVVTRIVALFADLPIEPPADPQMDSPARILVAEFMPIATMGTSTKRNDRPNHPRRPLYVHGPVASERACIERRILR